MFLGASLGRGAGTRELLSMGSTSLDVFETCNGEVLNSEERNTLIGSSLWMSKDERDEKTRQVGGPAR